MDKNKKKPVSSQKKSQHADYVKVSGHSKKSPGHTGLGSPNSIDSVRKPTAEKRPSAGSNVAGFSEPKVSPQTYDLYNTRPKSKSKDSKKKN